MLELFVYTPLDQFLFSPLLAIRLYVLRISTMLIRTLKGAISMQSACAVWAKYCLWSFIDRAPRIREIAGNKTDSWNRPLRMAKNAWRSERAGQRRRNWGPRPIYSSISAFRTGIVQSGHYQLNISPRLPSKNMLSSPGIIHWVIILLLLSP